MCLLDAALDWSATGITCSTRSHLSLDNPLRSDGRLHAVCGIEYGLQAAALHGALSNGSSQPVAYLGALRGVELHADRLDDPALGTLRVTAMQEMSSPQAVIYRFALAAQDGTALLSGRATLALLATAEVP